jgi:hypothetical protein
LATLVFFVLYYAWFLLRYSDFNNDDLDNFVLMRQMGVWQFLLTPVDVHFAPLHRLLTWLSYHIAPMNFSVAVLALIGFHVGTLICIYRSLRLLQLGRASDLIVCAYAASALVVFGLIWWAHAQHRAPYVFLDACAIYQYLAWLKSGRRANLWIAALAFVIAFGFYEKAVLIPLHMFVVGYLGDEARFRSRITRTAWLPAMLLCGSLAYVLIYLHAHPSSMQTSPAHAMRADLEFVKVLLAAVPALGVEAAHDVPVHGMSIRLAVLLLLGCTLFVYSIWRRDGSWKILFVLLLVLLIDDLPIALSNRISRYQQLIVPHLYRFGYEELHMVALLLGLWWARITVTYKAARDRQIAWLAGFALVLLYAGLNTLNLRASQRQGLSSLWIAEYSRNYMHHLRHDLAQIPERSSTFENDTVPGYLSLFRITPDMQTLLPLFESGARFVNTTEAQYKVLPDGHIVRVP